MTIPSLKTIRSDDLISSTPRIIKSYMNEEIARKIILEDDFDERVNIVYDYFDGSGYSDILRLFDAYEGEIEGFFEILENTFPEIVREKTLGRIGVEPEIEKEVTGISKPIDVINEPQDKSRVRLIHRGDKEIKVIQYNKPENVFMNNRLSEKSNIKIQQDFYQYFGYQRSIKSISNKKYRLRKQQNK